MYIIGASLYKQDSKRKVFLPRHLKFIQYLDLLRPLKLSHAIFNRHSLELLKQLKKHIPQR